MKVSEKRGPQPGAGDELGAAPFLSSHDVTLRSAPEIGLGDERETTAKALIDRYCG